MTEPKLIGIAGTFASGKDTLGHFLAQKYGYHLVSSSDIVRQFSMERHGSIERPFLYETAEYYRKHKGPAFFVQQLIDSHAKTEQGLIIGGLRAMGEANAIRDAGGIIVFTDAPSKIRYERMQARARDAESIVSYDEFVAREKSEWHAGDNPGDFSFKNLKASADHVLLNGHNTQEFFDDAVTALGL